MDNNDDKHKKKKKICKVLDPSISWQNRKSQGMVRLQSGTNR